MNRVQTLNDYCFNRLQAVESVLAKIELLPINKLRLTTERNILKHLIDYDTCGNFASVEHIRQYVEDSIDIICGFYE